MRQELPEMTLPAPEPPNFSLVQGGLLFQLFRRTHLCGDGLELLCRRTLTIALFAWLPLLALSGLEGHALGGSIRIPFLADIETHVRFLVALPMLLVAELSVHRRISPLIRRFRERRIVLTEDLPLLNAAVQSTLRLRNSAVAEITMLILVYTVGNWVWRSQSAPSVSTWYGAPGGAGWHFNMAGHWYALVSVPLFQFILLRWYMRLLLWFRLLWRISKLNLHLTAAHPDRAGGLGFLGYSSYAFGPILFAQGAVLSGVIASRVLYDGRDLISFKMEAAGLIGLMVFLILGPLVMFTPKLVLARRKGFADYALLANRYVFGFEEKWVHNRAPEMKQLLGSPDIQSLADLGNSYSIVSNMRIVPFGTKDITQLAAATAAPLLPLTLTIFSLEELLGRLLRLLF